MLNPDFINLLACPNCGASLHLDMATNLNPNSAEEQLICQGCVRLFPVIDRIPILLPCVQIAVFRRARGELGEGEEKTGTDVFNEETRWWDRFYSDSGESNHAPISVQGALPEDDARLDEALGDPYWDTLRKGIGHLPPGWQKGYIAAICCGRGVEFAHLAREGVRRVIGIDISLEGLQKARGLANRLGLEFEGIVGDVETLPLQSATVQVAYAHEGLHHLVSPAKAIREMYRIAKEAIMFCEPADALLTKIAALVGYSSMKEQSGARTYRLRRDDMERWIADLQPRQMIWNRLFVVTRVTFWPDGRIRSRPVPPFLKVANALLGQWLGNKCVVNIIK